MPNSNEFQPIEKVATRLGSVNTRILQEFKQKTGDAEKDSVNDESTIKYMPKQTDPNLTKFISSLKVKIDPETNMPQTFPEPYQMGGGDVRFTKKVSPRKKLDDSLDMM